MGKASRVLIALGTGGILGAVARVLLAYVGKRDGWLFPFCAPGVFLLDLLSLSPKTRAGMSMPGLDKLAPANAGVYGLLGLLGGALVGRCLNKRTARNLSPHPDITRSSR